MPAVFQVCIFGFNQPQTESVNADPVYVEGVLHYTTSYKGLEHPQILAFARIVQPIPPYGRMTIFQKRIN